MKYHLSIDLGYGSFKAYIYECNVIDTVNHESDTSTITLSGKMATCTPDNNEYLEISPFENQEWIDNDEWKIPTSQVFSSYVQATEKAQQLFKNWAELEQYVND